MIPEQIGLAMALMGFTTVANEVSPLEHPILTGSVMMVAGVVITAL